MSQSAGDEKFSPAQLRQSHYTCVNVCMLAHRTRALHRFAITRCPNSRSKPVADGIKKDSARDVDLDLQPQMNKALKQEVGQGQG